MRFICYFSFNSTYFHNLAMIKCFNSYNNYAILYGLYHK